MLFFRWEFLTYLSQPDNIKPYLKVTAHPAARRDLNMWQKIEDPEITVFLDQAMSAKSWYQPDNLAVDRIFNDMIKLVVEGQDVEKAVKFGAEQLSLLLKSKSESDLKD